MDCISYFYINDYLVVISLKQQPVTESNVNYEKDEVIELDSLIRSILHDEAQTSALTAEQISAVIGDSVDKLSQSFTGLSGKSVDLSLIHI